MPRHDPIPELKRQLGAEIAPLVTGWNSDDIGAIIGTDRARISELRRGKLDRFSLETLIRFLDRLRCTVELRVTPRPLFAHRPARGAAPAVGAPAVGAPAVGARPAPRAQGRDVT
ncbi:MAG TPA: XRE family transcriptional regulator [Gemmatimonadaceae bacterium]|nr:XRE family transcriptional regulator [Gemmatimonadaceae bacterium]